MKDSFNAALAFVLEAEGGFSDDPGDSGGATMRGITHTEYDAYRRAKGEPTQDVRRITEAEVEDIYRHSYWNAVGGDGLPAPLDLVMFDSGVNLGVGTAIKLLHQAVGLPPATSLDVRLLAAIGNAGSHLPVAVDKLLELRADRYRAIAHGHNARFLAGWLNRVDALREVIIKEGAASN